MSVNRPKPSEYKKHDSDPVDPSNIRAMTTRERARIQTFPDTFVFPENTANTEQMIGNAVPVQLATFVASSLSDFVDGKQYSCNMQFMNNGKEFLLFPQDLLAPICDSDFRLILLSAMRYAMGRNTCMPMVVADYIKRHIQLLDDKFLVLAADDIRRYLEDYAEHEPNSNLWQSLLGVLETEQRARATREARKIRPCPACGKPLEIMSIADSWHSPGGFDVIAHCRNCLADYEWFCDKDGGTSDMKQYFFG